MAAQGNGEPLAEYMASDIQAGSPSVVPQSMEACVRLCSAETPGLVRGCGAVGPVARAGRHGALRSRRALGGGAPWRTRALRCGPSDGKHRQGKRRWYHRLMLDPRVTQKSVHLC